jgi:hypothetical protein
MSGSFRVREPPGQALYLVSGWKFGRDFAEVPGSISGFRWEDRTVGLYSESDAPENPGDRGSALVGVP